MDGRTDVHLLGSFNGLIKCFNIIPTDNVVSSFYCLPCACACMTPPPDDLWCNQGKNGHAESTGEENPCAEMAVGACSHEATHLRLGNIANRYIQCPPYVLDYSVHHPTLLGLREYVVHNFIDSASLPMPALQNLFCFGKTVKGPEQPRERHML